MPNELNEVNQNKIEIITGVGRSNDKSLNFGCAALWVDNKEFSRAIYLSSTQQQYALVIECIARLLKDCKDNTVYLYQHADFGFRRGKSPIYGQRITEIKNQYFGEIKILCDSSKGQPLINYVRKNIDGFIIGQLDYKKVEGYTDIEIPSKNNNAAQLATTNKSIIMEIDSICEQLTPQQQEALLNYARGMAVSNSLAGETQSKKKRA